MTYDEYLSIEQDIMEAYKAYDLTEDQMEDELEELHVLWEEEGEQ